MPRAPIEFWKFTRLLPAAQCEGLIADAAGREFAAGTIGGGQVEGEVRRTDRLGLPTNVGIGSVLLSCGFMANQQAWNYKVDYVGQCELLRYGVDGRYQTHTDMLLEAGLTRVRKLTSLCLLSDPGSYQGGRFYIIYQTDRDYVDMNQGDVIVFPSFVAHGVEPVTAGTRYSCVLWVEGPPFR